jgi:hypothetical protein
MTSNVICLYDALNVDTTDRQPITEDERKYNKILHKHLSKDYIKSYMKLLSNNSHIK